MQMTRTYLLKYNFGSRTVQTQLLFRVVITRLCIIVSAPGQGYCAASNYLYHVSPSCYFGTVTSDLLRRKKIKWEDWVWLSKENSSQWTKLRLNGHKIKHLWVCLHGFHKHEFDSWRNSLSSRTQLRFSIAHLRMSLTTSPIRCQDHQRRPPLLHRHPSPWIHLPQQPDVNTSASAEHTFQLKANT